VSTHWSYLRFLRLKIPYMRYLQITRLWEVSHKLPGNLCQLFRNKSRSVRSYGNTRRTATCSFSSSSICTSQWFFLPWLSGRTGKVCRNLVRMITWNTRSLLWSPDLQQKQWLCEVKSWACWEQNCQMKSCFILSFELQPTTPLKTNLVAKRSSQQLRLLRWQGWSRHVVFCRSNATREVWRCSAERLTLEGAFRPDEGLSP